MNIAQIQAKKRRREAIRSERREVLNVLIPTLISYCDFSPASEYLFEVRANVEHLAKMCNQAYESWDKKVGKSRVRYDTILRALDMLESAELITVLREYDKTGKKHKAMRIWLNGEFFLMFGITEQQLRKLIVDFHKHQFVNNNLKKTFQSYQKHLDMLKYKGVSDIDKAHKVRMLLVSRRKAFLGEHIIKFVSQRKPLNYQELEVHSNLFEPCFRSFNDCNTQDEINALQKRLFLREELRKKARIKAANDMAFRKAARQAEEEYISQYA